MFCIGLLQSQGRLPFWKVSSVGHTLPRSCLPLSTTFCFPFIPALKVHNTSLIIMWKTNKGNRECFVKTFVDKHRTHFPLRNLIFPWWEIGTYEVQWSNSKNHFFVSFLFFKLDRPRPYNVMLYNGCVKKSRSLF